MYQGKEFNSAVANYYYNFQFFFRNFKDLIYRNKFDETSVKYAFDYFSKDRSNLFAEFSNYFKQYQDYSEFYSSEFYQHYSERFDEYYADFYLFYTEFKANSSKFIGLKKCQKEYQQYFDAHLNFIEKFESFLGKFKDYNKSGFYLRYQDYKRYHKEFQAYFA